MKFVFLFVLCFSGMGLLRAQNTIVDDLNTPVAGEGVIDIISDPAITALLGKPGVKATSDSGNSVIKMNGFRIQVYLGNDPKQSKSEASEKQKLVRSSFADTEAYIVYSAPNWKVLVGDFITREEANLFKQTLLKQCPQLGKEMYVIADKINVSVEK